MVEQVTYTQPERDELTELLQSVQEINARILTLLANDKTIVQESEIAPPVWSQYSTGHTSGQVVHTLT